MQDDDEALLQARQTCDTSGAHLNRHPRRDADPTDLIQVVLDDASVERLREAATDRGIEVEQLMVQLLHFASFRIDDVLGQADSSLS